MIYVVSGGALNSTHSRLRYRSRNFFKGFCIYYCGSYRQPRIKDEDPRRRFELCECFLVVVVMNMFTDSVCLNVCPQLVLQINWYWKGFLKCFRVLYTTRCGQQNWRHGWRMRTFVTVCVLRWRRVMLTLTQHLPAQWMRIMIIDCLASLRTASQTSTLTGYSTVQLTGIRLFWHWDVLVYFVI